MELHVLVQGRLYEIKIYLKVNNDLSVINLIAINIVCGMIHNTLRVRSHRSNLMLVLSRRGLKCPYKVISLLNNISDILDIAINRS